MWWSGPLEHDKASKDAKYELVKALANFKTIAEIFGNRIIWGSELIWVKVHTALKPISTTAVEGAEWLLPERKSRVLTKISPKAFGSICILQNKETALALGELSYWVYLAVYLPHLLSFRIETQCKTKESRQTYVIIRQDVSPDSFYCLKLCKEDGSFVLLPKTSLGFLSYFKIHFN